MLHSHLRKAFEKQIWYEILQGSLFLFVPIFLTTRNSGFFSSFLWWSFRLVPECWSSPSWKSCVCKTWHTKLASLSLILGQKSALWREGQITPLVICSLWVSSSQATAARVYSAILNFQWRSIKWCPEAFVSYWSTGKRVSGFPTWTRAFLNAPCSFINRSVMDFKDLNLEILTS